jgi:hypothetical protein
MRTSVKGITQVKGKKKCYVVTKYGHLIGYFYTFESAKQALEVWLKEYDSKRLLYPNPKCDNCVLQIGLQVLPLKTYIQ